MRLLNFQKKIKKPGSLVDALNTKKIRHFLLPYFFVVKIAGFFYFHNLGKWK